MKQLKHPNVVQLRHYFYQTTSKRREADGQVEEETFREWTGAVRAPLAHAALTAPRRPRARSPRRSLFCAHVAAPFLYPQ